MASQPPEYVPFHLARDRLEEKLLPEGVGFGSRGHDLWRQSCCKALIAALSLGALRAVFIKDERSDVPAGSWAWSEFADWQFAPDKSLTDNARRALPVLRGDERPVLEAASLNEWLEAIPPENPMLLVSLSKEIAVGGSKRASSEILEATYAEFWGGGFNLLLPVGRTVGLPDGLCLAVGNWVEVTQASLYEEWRRFDGGDGHLVGWSRERLVQEVLASSPGDELAPLRDEFFAGAISTVDAVALCRRLGVPLPTFLNAARGGEEDDHGTGQADNTLAGIALSDIALYAGGVTWIDKKYDSINEHPLRRPNALAPESTQETEPPVPRLTNQERNDRIYKTAVEVRDYAISIESGGGLWRKQVPFLRAVLRRNGFEVSEPEIRKVLAKRNYEYPAAWRKTGNGAAEWKLLALCEKFDVEFCSPQKSE